MEPIAQQDSLVRAREAVPISLPITPPYHSCNNSTFMLRLFILGDHALTQGRLSHLGQGVSPWAVTMAAGRHADTGQPCQCAPLSMALLQYRSSSTQTLLLLPRAVVALKCHRSSCRAAMLQHLLLLLSLAGSATPSNGS